MGETSGGSEVLVVEDDETIRESLCELLANELYDPIGCRSGEVAWTRLVSGLRPSVMVVDLALERMSGRELLKLLRGTVWGQTIPVLLLSGWHSPERFGDHADAVLGKDVDGTSIIRTIDRLALRGRRVETSEQDQPGHSMAAASC